MGADEIEREERPKKNGKPIVSHAIYSWMEAQGGPERFTNPEEAEADGDGHPAPAPATPPVSNQTLASLLQAIQSTEIAARMQGAAPAGQGLPVAPRLAGEAMTGDAAPTLQKSTQPLASAISTEPMPPPAAPPPGQSAAEIAAAPLSAIAGEQFAPSAVPNETEAGTFDFTGAGEAKADAAVSEPAVQMMKPPRARRPAKPRRSRQPLANAAGQEAMPPFAVDGQEAILSAETPECTAPSPALADALASPVAATAPQETPSISAQSEGGVFDRESREAAETLSAAGGTEAPLPTLSSQEVFGVSYRAKPEAPTEFKAPGPRPLMHPGPPAPSEPPAPNQPVPVFLAPILPTLPKSGAAGEPKRPVTVLKPRAPMPVDSTKGAMLSRLGGELHRAAAKAGLTGKRMTRVKTRVSKWIEKCFEAPDPRRSRRMAKPPLVAYYWAAGTPEAHRVANISSSGLYLLTEDRWPRGGRVSMTLQRTDRARGTPGSWIAIDFMVVRWCEDGLAGAFVTSAPGTSFAASGHAENCADRKTLERFIKELAPPAQR